MNTIHPASKSHSSLRHHAIRSALVLSLVTAVLGCGSDQKAEKRNLAQIAVWEDQGWTANGKLPTMLSDGSERVRERAALALGRVNDTLVVDSLARVLKDDPSPRVRGMAAFAFGIWQWRHGKSALLDAVVTERDPEALVLILQALARVYAREEAARYVHLLRHADPRVRAQTAQTLDITNSRDFADSILPLLEDPDLTVRRTAMYSLNRSRVERAARWAQDHLIDPDPTNRVLLYRLAGSFITERTGTALMQGLRDPDPRVRVAAADALLANRDTLMAREVLPLLAGETNVAVATRLARAVGEHWYRPAAPVLAALLDHPDPGVRAQAAAVLCNQRDALCGAAIAPVVTDPDPRVRLAFMEAIDKAARIGAVDTAAAYPLLQRLCADPVPRVRAAAVTSYAGVGGPGWEIWVDRLFHDTDPQAVATAVGLLGTLKMFQYADSLPALYLRYREDPNPDVKWAILASATNLLPTVRIDSIRQNILDWAMADPNRLVRWYAIAVAFKFKKDLRGGLGIYRTDLTVDNIDSLLPVYRTPPLARVETTRGPITIRLASDWAPRTVRQFIAIARGGVYDRAVVENTQAGYMVQFGDRSGSGGDFPPADVREEYSPLPIEAGTVFWAVATRDAGRGNFAIALERLPYQDWRYAVLGQVVEGLETARALTMADSVRSVVITIPEG